MDRRDVARGMFLPVADAVGAGGRAVVIAPAPLPPAVRTSNTEDSVEEVWRDQQATGRTATRKISKRRPKSEALSWPRLASTHLVKRSLRDEKSDARVRDAKRERAGRGHAPLDPLCATEQRVAAARRVYETPPAISLMKKHPNHHRIRTPPSQFALDPINSMKRQQQFVVQQRDELAKAVERRIDDASRTIPVQFLMEQENRHAFAQRVLLLAMCRVLRAHYVRVARVAWYVWRKRTLTLRIVEEQERKLFLLRQSSIAHASAIVQRHIICRLRAMLTQWKDTTDKLRHLEHMYCATRVQKCWRAWSMQRTLKSLALLYRERVRYASAVRIQSVIRRFLAQCELARMLWSHRRQMAALRIQNSYRNYVVVQITKRHRHMLAAATIQRTWRGRVGRRHAQCRRRSCRAAVVHLVEERWQTVAVVNAAFKHTRATKIQRLFRTFTYRKQVDVGIRHSYRRRHFFPARCIQRGWYAYRSCRIRFIAESLVFRVMMTHMAAARRIQHCFKVYWRKKLDNAALSLTRLLRSFCGKRDTTNNRLIPWMRQWQSRYLEQWCAICVVRTESRWAKSLRSVQNDVSRYYQDQASGLCRLNVHAGLRLLSQVKQFHKFFLQKRSRQIQLVWRLHRFKVLIARLRGATLLLRRALSALYRQHKCRQRRQRVLYRWRRQRYIELHTRFDIWKVLYLVRLQARELATTTRNVRKALWFRHHKLRQHVVRRWMMYVMQRRIKRGRLKTAIVHANLLLSRKMWRVWNEEALPNMCCANRLNELVMTLGIWNTWQEFLRRKQLSHMARQHRTRRIMCAVFEVWKQDWADFARELVVAGDYRCYQLKRKGFLGLARHATMAKKVQEFYKRRLEMCGVRRWLESVYDIKRERANQNAAVDFRNHCQARSSWIRWITYCRHQTRQREKLRAMELHYERHRSRQIVSIWNQELVPMWSDYHLIQSVAMVYRARRLKERYFRLGFRVFWELTAGARRVAMATRIQRTFRSSRARKRIVFMRLKVKYQLETRASMGADIRLFTVATLQATLESHQWVFVLFSTPWDAANARTKEIFCKTATTWSFLRNQGSRLAFGFVDATDMLSVQSQSFSLMTWLGFQPDQLPCVVGFWQGVGPACSSTETSSRLASGGVRELKRRFKRICCASPCLGTSLVHPTSWTKLGNSESYVTMPQLVVWIERLQQTACEATVVDLQSYIRGYLVRRHTKRYRIIKNERRKQRVREWCTKLIQQWRTSQRQHAAQVLQQWIRHFQARRRFWAAFWLEVQRYKQATQRLQRSSCGFLNRLRLKRALLSLLANPQRYPDSPLCQACLIPQNLARLRCRDCSQVFCGECFTLTHKTGKRLLHLCDNIDFVSFSKLSSRMCKLCEVRRSVRFCLTCDHHSLCGYASFCTNCFEATHTDDPEKIAVTTCKSKLKRRWWESTAFRLHEWKRTDRGLSEEQLDIADTASAVMVKHGWQSWAMMVRMKEQIAHDEESSRQREGRLLAIRVQQEAILRDAFDRYDSDESGAIDRSEFKRMFKEELCEPLTDEQVDQAMARMDKSGNGLVEFDELLAWFAEDALTREESGAKDQAEPRSLSMLKDALRAKRQMRRYKEKLNEFVPTVTVRLPNPHSLSEAISQLTERRIKKRAVPGFPSVECLDHADFAHKRKVFYRFVKEICGLEWIFEDEAAIPIANAMEVFDETFVPRWNAGELTYDFYFDDESFEYEGEVWQRKWIPESKKYVFTTIRRKMRKLDTTTGYRKRRKRWSVTSTQAAEAVQVTEEIEETVEVVEPVDPRRKRMLLEQAQEAFKTADVDNSGFIDGHEFYRMLKSELCEPVSKSKAKQIMKQLDSDGSGKIDFHEFFHWYAVEKCQDYPMTPQMARARALLQTKRRAKATAAAAIHASVAGGLQLKQALARRQKEQRLANDCKGASAEMIILLQEGYSKPLAEKALTLHNQDVTFARKWLRDKLDQEQQERDEAVRARADKKAQARKAAHEKQQNRRQRMVALRKQIKLLVVGPSKKEAHATRVQQALSNLDREIQLVERQLGQ